MESDTLPDRPRAHSCALPSSGRTSPDDFFRDDAVAPASALVRSLAVGYDHPAIRGAVIAFVTDVEDAGRA